MEPAHGPQIATKPLLELIAAVREGVTHDPCQRPHLGYTIQPAPGKAPDLIEPDPPWSQDPAGTPEKTAEIILDFIDRNPQ